jgi:hypothetical protein
MELIIMLLAPLPVGYFIRNRMAAYLAYVALHSFVFTFQLFFGQTDKLCAALT